jgi:hypothetical protein
MLTSAFSTSTGLVGQPHRQAGAHHRPEQRGVGGKSRQHLPGLRGLEELRIHPQHLLVDGLPQVSRDPAVRSFSHYRGRRRRHIRQRFMLHLHLHLHLRSIHILCVTNIKPREPLYKCAPACVLALAYLLARTQKSPFGMGYGAVAVKAGGLVVVVYSAARACEKTLSLGRGTPRDPCQET